MKKSISTLFSTFSLIFFLCLSGGQLYGQFCCCSGTGCFPYNAGFPDCDAMCPALGGQTNEGNTAPYADLPTCTAACILPIELAYFSAEAKKGKGVELTWRTYAEIENSGFEIQRMSGVELKWETLGFVEGQGSTIQTYDYIYYDEIPPVGINYYRLKQIDLNGMASYSQVESVNHDASAIFSVWPTLARDYLFVLFEEGLQDSGSRLEVRDLMGRKILEQFDTRPIDIQDLNAGHYLVSYYTHGQVYTQRFIKAD